MKKIPARLLGVAVAVLLISPSDAYSQREVIPTIQRAALHQEVPDQNYLAPSENRVMSPARRSENTGFFTSQVNVDASGNNITGDAANEPSIAVNPANPDNMVIGWRQFDNVNSNFRQAGYGYSSNGGQNWTFPGVIEPFIFRSDPVLDFDTAGNFFYNSLTSNAGIYSCKVFKSTNGGAGWDQGTEAHGGDKQWMAIDRTDGEGSGNIYSCWNSGYSSCQPGFFTRSADAGASYEDCTTVAGFPYWGTMAVGPDGELYVSGAGAFDYITVSKSSDAKIPGSTITWDYLSYADLDGYIVGSDPINPEGIMGQANVEVDCSDGPGRGNVYVLASVARISVTDPADVMFTKSTGLVPVFDPPQRLNSDAGTDNHQWFGTMSVAPNGRIDVAWLDTRDGIPGTYLSALYYCYSDDQGETWSANKRLSDLFDPTVGYPQQSKMGDYIDMVSDNGGAHLAWTNTLNGEQDVYYTHIIPTIVGLDEQPGVQDRISISCSPNPFRTNAVVRYHIPCNCFVQIDICNLTGTVIRTLVAKDQPAGAHTIALTDQDLAPGFYLCRLSAGTQSETTRLIRLN